MKWFVLLFTALAVGCSDSTIGIVSGTVTIDGEPAETGAVTFVPVDGKTGPAGTKIVDGAFEATLPVGPAKVQIRVPKIVGQTKIYNTPDSPIQDVMAESLPAKYNDETELIYDVPPGKSQHDFDLSTKSK